MLNDGPVTLRAIEARDLAQLAAWRNDPTVRRQTREWRLLTAADQERWFARISGPDRKDFMFVIEVDGTPIGAAGLVHWDARDRTAEISYYIGEPDARGAGHATRALRLLHRYGFGELGLERIFAEVFADNAGSLALLKKLGYTQEGVLRQHVFRDGERLDSVIFGLLRREWKDA
jgi:RimJ/RimL family protein N-acetyltransferase